MEKRRYYALDAMRGLAAVCVVVYHFSERLAPSAYLAVDFFFVLSGFVISQAYTEKLNAGLGTTAFMQARLRRLWPLYIVGIAVGFLQILALTFAGLRSQGVLDLFSSLALNSVFLPSLSVFFLRDRMQGLFPINGPAWSMFWELAINLAFVVSLIKLRTRTLVVVAAAALLLLITCIVAYGSLNVGWEWRSFAGGIPRVTLSFSFGILLYRLFGSRPPIAFSRLAIAAGLALMALMLVPAHGQIRIIYDVVFVALLSPAIVAAGIFVEVPARLRGMAEWLGYISYPVYILHRGIVGLYKPAYEHLGLSPFIGVVGALLLVGAFAYLAARLMDAYLARK